MIVRIPIFLYFSTSHFDYFFVFLFYVSFQKSRHTLLILAHPHFKYVLPIAFCSSGATGAARGLKRSSEEDYSDAISVSSMSSKRSRILPTDDPVLADKRHRNRIAAEKCRDKRKARQMAVAEDNKRLRERFASLEREHEQLKDLSKSVLKSLRKENSQLKVENESLRAMLGNEPSLPLILQHQS